MSKHYRFLNWSLLTPEVRRAVCSTAVERARRMEPRLHAFVEFASDQDISSRSEPLAFLPYAAKDLFFAPNHRPRNGLANGIVSGCASDAEVLRCLNNAGAGCIGFTAMTELAYEPSGYTAVSEWPRNPSNFDFVPGGSSSGSAIAVASGVVPFALGSDTGGSIRIPAHCCGVTGWKPSFGALSTIGALPLAPFLDCIGLLARSVADLALAADVLLPNAPLPRPIDHVVLLADALQDAEPAVRRACNDGIDLLRSLAVKVSCAEALPAIAAIDQHALIVLQGEAARTYANQIDHTAINAVLRKRLAKGLTVDDATLSASRAKRAQLVNDFTDQILGTADAAILPVMPIRTPPYRDVDPTSPTFSGRRLYDLSRYCRFANMLGLPALAVPVGFDDRGLPVALQLIGRHRRDRDLFALGARMQEKTNWHARVPVGISDLVDVNMGLCA